MAGSLVCPGCGAPPTGGERFCAHCGMPLVPRGEAVVSERQERARKIDPRYTDGPLSWVAGARNQVEAELIAGLLLEHGVPSLIRRAPGFDVPDFMASGPREILVPATGLPIARALLAATASDSPLAATSTTTRPARVLAAVLLVIALLTVVLFLGTHLWD